MTRHFRAPSRSNSTAPSERRPRRRVPRRDDRIEIRGAKQNNLDGIDLDVPINQLTVVTGPSGSGKSSLAFQTIYAEGQRRYVETFSPYTRQFFDRMDKPQVDEIRGIPPAIAIEQANNVRTTRSTVGTVTEINDYLKLLFPRIASAFCPECEKEIRPDSVQSIYQKVLEEFPKKSCLVTFGVPVPKSTKTADLFAFLKQQGYARARIYGQIIRVEEPRAMGRRRLPAVVDVIQDRVRANDRHRTRFLEALEAALQIGKGRVAVVEEETGAMKAYSKGWECADCQVGIRPPTPGLFSFNSPLGACPTCRGFGRTIGIDLDRALPDRSLSIRDGVVKAFQGKSYSECQDDLVRLAGDRGIDIDLPYEDLSDDDRDWVLNGDCGPGGDAEEAWREGEWYGIQGFFDWVETKAYKMHVRVFLSRFRSYTKCRDCQGSRLQPEVMRYRWVDLAREEQFSLPQWWQMPIADLAPLLERISVPAGEKTVEMLRQEVHSRLRYLERVGLGYLNLDRSSRTLSGGEMERVNLTTCLGASLVNTLFVMDEPSVGLHPRDIGRLIEVMHSLRDRGNTLIVVEHEEAVIRSADHLVEIGPGRGECGGQLVYEGSIKGLSDRGKETLTGAYMTGGKAIELPTSRRPARGQIGIRGAAQNNLKKIDINIPLGVLCCVSGVSGSGKSTLVHQVLHENLLRKKGQRSEAEPGRCRDVIGTDRIDQVVMVDQSPLARTPRSTPAVYIGAFGLIRKLFAEVPDAVSQGMTMGHFSFNSGAGRCERCWGTGLEKIEMQFLSDLYVTCSECEGKRYQEETLKIQLSGKSLFEVLQMTTTEAIDFFENIETRKASQVVEALQLLADVGLGYLRLGQPINTLSGGESQRLKLVGHLLETRPKRGGKGSAKKQTNLLIFDEPTTGLHFDDIALLLRVFERLVKEGESLLVIEHNVEVLKCADYIIDLGPEAGAYGGEIVAAGTPEEIAENLDSHTGRHLVPKLFQKRRMRATPDHEGALVAEAPPAYGRRKLPVLRTKNEIQIYGAREHNLKNVDVSIPRDELVVVTGLSGSGKSTLAFDVLFAEGQRRFLDSMSPYARQFAQQLEKPEVDLITGLPPTVVIEQRLTRGGAKSTVATITEVYHFLRLLYAKTGTQYCPDCVAPVEKQSLSAIVTILRKAAKIGPIKLMAPLVKARKGFHTEVARWAGHQGFEDLYVDGEFKKVEGFERLERFVEHSVDVVVGELRKTDSVAEVRDFAERALRIGKGTARFLDRRNRFTIVSSEMSCPDCGRAFEELDPRLFSFNSPHGCCERCHGYGTVHRKAKWYDGQDADSMLEAELREDARVDRADDDELLPCPACDGTRISATAQNVRVLGESINGIAGLSVHEAIVKIGALKFKGAQRIIARDILREILQRLRFMEEVGLGYLTLTRSAKTLSGGESQRIRLAAQLGSNLRGVLYVLDEPTIGLHPRDNEALLDTLVALRDQGNSLLVVEHDEDTMRRSDRIIDLGPGAGSFGGEVTAVGTFKQIARSGGSVTGKYLKNPMQHPLRGERRGLPGVRAPEGWIRVSGASANNLKRISVKIPVGRLTVICGISGSGKSSFMRGVLEPAVRNGLVGGRKRKLSGPITWKSVSGAEQIEAVYEVDQSPIGKTSRSTPATYVKVFDDIRKLFAQVAAARVRGYTASRFSFNNEGGRCETCKGNGQIKLEMIFLPTSYVPCEDCNGKRYNAATLEIEYNGVSIGEVMHMTVDEATEFFAPHPRIHRTLSLLRDTGLGYLRLGQPSPTLSGGEAQRIKLVTELTKGVGRSENARLRKNRTPKSSLCLIEEPTIGLHMADVKNLLAVVHRLVDDGQTVVIIEHNLDFIAEADYLIEIGPEAGEDGGRIVAAGPPEKVLKVEESRTAPFLKKVL